MTTAAELKVAQPTIDAIEDALHQFESLVNHYAGDRTTFDSMVSSFGDKDSAQVDNGHRRAAFRANSHIWGIQSRAHVVTNILHRNANDPDRFDAVTLQGSYDLRQLRRNASWTVAEFSARHDKGARVSAKPEPLDTAAGDPTGFLAEFSSKPRPPIRIGRHSAGFSSVELAGDTIGIPSEISYMFGHVMRAIAPWYRTEADSHIRARASVRGPTEVMIFDLLVDAQTFGQIMPEVFLLSDLARNQSITDPRLCPSHHLPTRDKSEYLGRGTSELHTPDLPHYTEMLEWAINHLGWENGDFQTFRIRTEYPVLPSSLVMEFPLPER